MLTIIVLLFINCESTGTSNVQKQEVSEELELKEDKITNDDFPNTKKSIEKEIVENHQKITQKYGKQLDFCSCIQFHDSLNNAAQKDLSDKQIEKLLNRWEQMEVKCKELVNTEHRTPEERLAHERKVQKCLN